jgi:pyruvate kinase
MVSSKFAQTSEDTSDCKDLLAMVRALRGDVIDEGDRILRKLGAGSGVPDSTLVNLAHYLALRHHDLRGLQRQLMCHGLSSLGRIESRVLLTLDAVLAALSALTGQIPKNEPASAEMFFSGEARLNQAADRLLGPRPVGRRGRIMVTLPGDAGLDPNFLPDLVRRGMDIARINCAHDNPDIWRDLSAKVREAGEAAGRKVSILMDIAGPKIRTGAVAMSAKRMQTGDRFRLIASGVPHVSASAHFSAVVSLPEMVTRLAPGHRIRYDDGKLEGVVESVGHGAAVVRVTRTKPGGTKLKSEKGLNLPDTSLGVLPLTTKDEKDLSTVIACADMIGYSFVSQPSDVDLFEAALSRLGAASTTIGLIAKIEQPHAVSNLPALIAKASGSRPFGVMIARGDLAAEIGFERLAEMQEEILWICEAASVPVIWATQVLEGLVKDGVPSRGEMTDAAMAARAECVMLNKGPSIGDAVELIDRLFRRMEGHIFKKTPTLRALKSW